ncbi:MAG: TRAP transporter substrate-binding protein DctP [Candidatus Atribacteria bacterium]|nr:TRAP transporter substrate-binding protein DctP [Candidatus Atribacteria bacterium]
MKKSLILVIALGLSIILISFQGFAQADVVNWKISTCWPPSINLIEGDIHMCEIVDKMSGGRFKIELLPADSIVPTTELFDAVRTGMLDAGSDYPGYWSGKEKAFEFFFSFPVGMSSLDMEIWLYHGGGLELIREIYGKYNMMYFPVGRAGMESGLRSNKPLESKEDFKGVKARMGGGSAPNFLFNQLGGSEVTLAGGEIYTALELGTIDAAEFSMPMTDWKMGFAEVTKYWCLPGWHQPMWAGGWMINMDSWNALPDDLKEIFEVAARETSAWTYAKWEYESIEAIDNFLEAGTVITKLDEDTVREIYLLAKQYVEENSEKDPMFKKVAISYYDFLKNFSTWRDMEDRWGFGSNLEEEYYPDLK